VNAVQEGGDKQEKKNTEGAGRSGCRSRREFGPTPSPTPHPLTTTHTHNSPRDNRHSVGLAKKVGMGGFPAIASG